jgi:hypothetical protein
VLGNDASVFRLSKKSMTYIHPVYLRHECKRFTRAQAHLFIRPDWRRYICAGSADDQLYRFFERIEQKYYPEQPRVPKGGPGAGQWTSDGDERSDPRILSDSSPDPVLPGSQHAQYRTREGFARVFINGQQVEPTPGQQARLAVVEARARDAIQRVRELDRNWRPTPSTYESVEGLIKTYQSDTRQAQDRISELQQVGIGPGQFAKESISARGPDRNFTVEERRQLNEIGEKTGCHTCGSNDPGTRSGNFVADHQPPTALNFNSNPQRLFPQCVTCSLRQGGWIAGRGANK